MNFFLRRSKSLKPQVRITEACLKLPFHQCPTRHPGLAVTAAREALWDHVKKNLRARRQEAKKLCLAAEAAAAVEQTAAAAARDTPPASTPVSAGRTLPQPDEIDDYDGRDASDDGFDNMAGDGNHATPPPVIPNSSDSCSGSLMTMVPRRKCVEAGVFLHPKATD